MEPPINFLTLHRDSSRHTYFTKNTCQDPFFDATTRSWIVTNPSHCRELIGSKNLRPVTYSADYKALETRFGIDFSGVVFAFDYIPLCQHGEDHLRLRRRMSEFIAGRKAALNARIPVAVSEHFGALRREGQVEIMKDVVIPLALDIISTVANIDIETTADCQNASVLFDRLIGVAKRRKIAAEIAILRERISSHLGKQASDEDVGLRLALVILGRDALIGTLGESLYRLIDQNPGRRLAEISYPDLPPETGVPYIERLVITPFNLAGCDFARGNRVRIFLQTFAYSAEPRSRKVFFGAGAHACLGRPLSIDIWNAITGLLSTISLRAEVLSYSARSSDYVFACPERLEVALSQ